MKKFLLGAHMPITGGFYHAAEFGQATGCSAIQIFTKSNRQWQAKPIITEEADKFKAAIKQHNIEYVVAHASYLINLASPEQHTQHKSIVALATELDRCNQLGIQHLVLHPGSALELPQDHALRQVAQNIDLAVEKSTSKTKILLETMAGQGSSVGNNFEQIATIISSSKHQGRIGVCLDTCHIFAAGYDFTTPSNYKRLWQEFDKAIGINKLELIHLNDSKKELGSKVDRHTNIGEGAIGLNSFELIMNDSKLLNIPKILETPKESLEDDKKNIKKLVDLLKPESLDYLKDTNLRMYME